MQTKNTTENGLNQWLPEDELNTEQFSEDNRIIEKLLQKILTAETPDDTILHSGIYLKLIRSNLNWQTPQSESEAEPLAGYMLLDDGTQKKGAVELDNGDIKDLFLLPT